MHAQVLVDGMMLILSTLVGRGVLITNHLSTAQDRLIRSTVLSSVCGALWGHPSSLPQILET